MKLTKRQIILLGAIVMFLVAILAILGKDDAKQELLETKREPKHAITGHEKLKAEYGVLQDEVSIVSKELQRLESQATKKSLEIQDIEEKTAFLKAKIKYLEEGEVKEPPMGSTGQFSVGEVQASLVSVAYAMNAGDEFVDEEPDYCGEADKRGWTDCTHRKLDYMVEEGMPHKYAVDTIDVCKTKAINPGWCVELITHLRVHETGRGKNNGRKKYNNPFGFLQGGHHMRFGSVNEALVEFVTRYNKYWYNSNCSDMVYRSRYTTTQKQERINNCHRTQNNLSESTQGNSTT